MGIFVICLFLLPHFWNFSILQLVIINCIEGYFYLALQVAVRTLQTQQENPNQSP